MMGKRTAKVFSSRKVGEDYLIYIDPQGETVVYGDTVLVGDGESVCFSAGGRSMWFRDPGVYTIGYDERSESEILRAHIMGEDMQGMPMLVNTSVAFCNLKPYVCRVGLDGFIKLNKMVGLKPVFQLRMHVQDDEALLSCVTSNNAAREKILSSVYQCLTDELKAQMKESGVFDEYTIFENVEQEFANSAWTDEILLALQRAATRELHSGVAVDEVRVVDWGLWSGFCDVCGECVDVRAGRCDNGHRLFHCPVCRELIYDGSCKVYGHRIMYCRECGKYVVHIDGACLVHRKVVM